MKNFVQPGEILTLIAPAGGVVSGTLVKVGNFIGVATVTAAAGEKFTCLLEGVIDHAKVAAQAWTEGQQINFDNATKLLTSVTTGNFKVGVATEIAANPTSTGKIRLNGIDVGAALP